MCNKAVDKDPEMLMCVPDHLKTHEMCDKAVAENPYLFKYVPDKFKTPEMCDKAVDTDPKILRCVPDKFKTREMCDKLIDKYPGVFRYVPDCFITLEMIINGTEFREWFNGYKERKAQKSQIKDELMPIAWYPSRAVDWCFDEEEKKDLKRLWGEC